MGALLALLPGGPFLSLAASFLGSRVGIALMVGAAAFAAGHHMAASTCDADALRSQLYAARADLLAAGAAADLAKRQADAAAASADSNADKVKELESDLAKRSGRTCGLSSDDARRLRAIK